MNAFAQFQFLTPDNRIADVPGSRGILPLESPTKDPVKLMREARQYCRNTSHDFARIVIMRDGRSVAVGKP